MRTPAPPQVVLSAFLRIEHLKIWWGVDRCLIKPREGGIWACAWDRSRSGYRYASTGIITRYDEGRSLRIEKMIYFHPDHPILGPLDLTITVGAVAGESEVSVLQEGYGTRSDWDWHSDPLVGGWPATLARLRDYLDREY